MEHKHKWRRWYPKGFAQLKNLTLNELSAERKVALSVYFWLKDNDVRQVGTKLHPQLWTLRDAGRYLGWIKSEMHSRAQVIAWLTHPTPDKGAEEIVDPGASQTPSPG